MLEVIEEARVDEERRLLLRFADGCAGTVDLSDLLDRGGVFERLRDDAVFAQVRVGGAGRWLEWPGDIDLCADALYQCVSPTA